MNNVLVLQQDEHKAPLTEPEIIPCLFTSGVLVTHEDGAVTFVGWRKQADGGEIEERRIQTRFVMTTQAAMNLHRLLGIALSESWRSRS